MSNYSNTNFAKMIERMEDLVLAGMGIPLTPLTMVNSEKLVPLLDRIRESLPDEIKNAQRVLDQREEILTESQQRANQLLLDAKAQAEYLLSESELLKAVHAEAERVRHQILTEIDTIRKKAFEEAESMKAKAYEEARAAREGADQYADLVLGSLDKSLSEFHGVVRNGQKHLKRAKLDAHAHAHQQQPGTSTTFRPGYATPHTTGLVNPQSSPYSVPALNYASAYAGPSSGMTGGNGPTSPFPPEPMGLGAGLNADPTQAGNNPLFTRPERNRQQQVEDFLKQTTL